MLDEPGSSTFSGFWPWEELVLLLQRRRRRRRFFKVSLFSSCSLKTFSTQQINSIGGLLHHTSVLQLRVFSVFFCSYFMVAAVKMMEFIEDKFTLKSQAMKASDYYMDQVMESLDTAHYFTKSAPKCGQAFGLQSSEHRSSPCGDQNGE